MLRYLLLLFTLLYFASGEWPDESLSELEVQDVDFQALSDILMPNISRKYHPQFNRLMKGINEGKYDSTSCSLCKVCYHMSMIMVMSTVVTLTCPCLISNTGLLEKVFHRNCIKLLIIVKLAQCNSFTQKKFHKKKYSRL